MAEVTRRSFDLKSWQGLTLVLKVARESGLSQTAYADFRNLVLEYAQGKGTDQSLKVKIDAIIDTFDEPRSASPASNEVAKDVPERQGRRVVPSFGARTLKVSTAAVHEQNNAVDQSHVNAPPVAVAPPVPPAPPVVPEQTTTIPAVPEVPPPAEVGSPVPEADKPLRSVEEHRTRIMEIKREVNAHVKNPVSLADGNNKIGREYMTALLRALKATSPGMTHDLEPAMSNLESVFSEVIAFVSQPHAQGIVDNHHEQEVVHDAVPIEQTQSPAVPPLIPEVQEEIPAPPEIPIEPVSELPPQAFIPEPEVSPVAVSQNMEEDSHGVEEIPPVVSAEKTDEDTKRWSEDGGDASMDEQLQALREQLQRVEGTETQSDARPARRSLIPSLIDLEDEPVATPQTEVHGTAWDPHHAGVQADELSPAALAERPTSSLTGITLGTPQSELMAPEVTMALTELLHEWKIFASSGLFGMGPGGIEHPLYIRLARLPMGAVLSGRFDDANMKTVKNIKDYVDAWRHEQGIAYNPTETFEHYLRRVSQRIMKRQTN